MIDSSSPEFDALAQVYLVANTPGYLFRRFRTSPLVQRLGASYPAHELANVIRNFIALGAPTLKDSVTCCIAAAALASKSPSEVLQEISELPTQRSVWLSDLLQLCITGRSLTVQTVADIQLPKPSLFTSDNFLSGTSVISPHIVIELATPKALRIQDEMISSTSSGEVKIDYH